MASKPFLSHFLSPPLSPPPSPHHLSLSLSLSSPRPSHSTLCKSTQNDSLSSPLSLSVGLAGLISSPTIALSLYTLKTSGCGLPPGPAGSLGALEGISYLTMVGIVGWSVVRKVRTGTGLPAGQYGLLGAAEGLSWLVLVAVVVVFGLQVYETGSLPGPLPSGKCFG